MAKQKETRSVTDLVNYQPTGASTGASTSAMTVLPPSSGVVGQFIQETQNMFKARAMRMTGLLRRINESGQRTEQLLRQASERMEAAEAALETQFRSEGLLPDAEGEETEG